MPQQTSWEQPWVQLSLRETPHLEENQSYSAWQGPGVPWLRNRVGTGAAILFVFPLVVYQEPSVCPVSSEIHDKEGGASITGQRAEPMAAGQVFGGLLKPWRAATHLCLAPSTLAIHLAKGGRAEGSRK